MTLDLDCRLRESSVSLERAASWTGGKLDAEVGKSFSKHQGNYKSNADCILYKLM